MNERRRLEDRVPSVLLASLEPRSERALTTAVGGTTTHGPASSGTREEQAPLLLVEEEGGQVLCVAGGVMWRLPKPQGVPVAEVVDVIASNVREYHTAALRKYRFHDGFMVYVERLNRARSREDIYDAMLEQLPQLMGAYATVLLIAGRAGEAGLELRPITDARVPIELGILRATEAFTRPVPTLITPDATSGPAYAGLTPLFTQLGARQLICIALGPYGVLLLIERRQPRDLSGEEWFRLQTLAHHAQRCIERVDLAADVAIPVQSIALH